MHCAQIALATQYTHPTHNGVKKFEFISDLISEFEFDDKIWMHGDRMCAESAAPIPQILSGSRLLILANKN